MRFLIIFAVFIASAFASDEVNLESKLINSLLKNYDARVRPVKSYATAVPVKFGLAISNIDAGPNNVFSLVGWSKMYWTDEYLQWTPAEHGNIKTIKAHPYIMGQDPKIWTPDIALTAAGKTERSDVGTVRAFIQNTGNVTYFQPRVYKIPCYPVAGAANKVTCTMHFGSWAYSKSEIGIDLMWPGDKIESYVDAKSAWKIIGNEIGKQEYSMPSLSDAPWEFVNIKLTLQKAEA